MQGCINRQWRIQKNILEGELFVWGGGLFVFDDLLTFFLCVFSTYFPFFSAVCGGGGKKLYPPVDPPLIGSHVLRLFKNERTTSMSYRIKQNTNPRE